VFLLWVIVFQINVRMPTPIKINPTTVTVTKKPIGETMGIPKKDYPENYEHKSG
jgi:hypothetical protein